MRYLVILFISLIFIGCFDMRDEATQITPEDITGVWIAVRETPSDVWGLYKKDTVIYRIGLDPIVDTISAMVYDKLSFNAQGKSVSSHGFLYRPWETYGRDEYDYDLYVPFIVFKLRLRSGSGYSETEIKFSYIKDSSTDTIDVSVGSETFGLKRRGI